MSKESIVQKIISDAEERANSYIEEQTLKAEDILKKAADECNDFSRAFKSETDKMVAEIESRAKTGAELDAKKIMLATKTKVLDGVFFRALEKMASQDLASCKNLFISMLDMAEDGDVITLGKNQKGFLSEHDVEEVAKSKGIKLALSDVCGNFDGMILSGNGVDKNFTFEVEIAALREEMETQLAKEIFG